MFAFLVLVFASAALAHQAVDQPGLGRLIVEQEIVARGAIVRASAMQDGALVARLRTDAVLKGTLPSKEVDFASDPDHGVRYQQGERVLVFLARAGPKPPPFVSPQIFAMKYPITSFDPSGYDALVAGLVDASRLRDRTARLAKLKQVVLAALGSHEKSARLYAASQLAFLTRQQDAWHDSDWERLAALAGSASMDTETRAIVRRLLDARRADVVRQSATPAEGGP